MSNERYMNADDYGMGMPLRQPNLSVRDVRDIARGYVNEIRRSAQYHEDNPEARLALEDLVEELLARPRLKGSPEDFHNLAVMLGSSEYEDLACEVLDRALQRYPLNVHLLADFLIYGIDCERQADCGRYMAVLESLPKSDWTWRGFAFGIAYLTRMQDMAASAEERGYYKEKAAQLAQEYRQYLPGEEGGYRETAKLHANDPSKELMILQEAMDSPKVGACPSCAFRCADILFEQKKYVEALDAVNRSIADCATQKQGGINEFYLYFLRGLCKLAIGTSDNTPVGEEAVLDIYADFNIALIGVTGNYVDTIRNKTRILEQQTGVHVPDLYERLVSLVEY